ncbi:hypothetical protein [Borrelia hermsii]|uniref:Uncharacterized protein n=1 Tax=Borrelia hermsii MTW TaxID=1313291 RepID=W5T6A7_BORHE|nr:hypothetical protein [Borrelia hermsii]AHH14699.1 hypothetical protein BHW_0900047 [Borrelia hermsii MTW]
MKFLSTNNFKHNFVIYGGVTTKQCLMNPNGINSSESYYSGFYLQKEQESWGI